MKRLWRWYGAPVYWYDDWLMKQPHPYWVWLNGRRKAVWIERLAEAKASYPYDDWHGLARRMTDDQLDREWAVVRRALWPSLLRYRALVGVRLVLGVAWALWPVAVLVWWLSQHVRVRWVS